MAKVDWIDKIAPTAKVVYSTTDKTSNSVIATLTGESEEITITNNDGNRNCTFSENGEFVYEFMDKAGNRGTVLAKVDWIIKEEEKPEGPVKIGDIDGNGKLGPTDLAKLKLHLIGKQTLTDRALKAADINQDGRITATDLAQLKLALIGKIELK